MPTSAPTDSATDALSPVSRIGSRPERAEVATAAADDGLTVSATVIVPRKAPSQATPTVVPDVVRRRVTSMPCSRSQVGSPDQRGATVDGAAHAEAGVVGEVADGDRFGEGRDRPGDGVLRGVLERCGDQAQLVRGRRPATGSTETTPSCGRS